MKKTTVSMFLMMFLATATLVTAASMSPIVSNVTSSGVIATPGLKTSVNNIDWGTLFVGSTVSQQVTITNNGTVPLTLSMTVDTWNPIQASSYITISWDQTGVTLQPGDSVTATFTITIAANVTGFTTFSNIIHITGIE